MTQPTRRPSPAGVALAVTLDIAFVMLFAWTGRREHTREMTLGGLVETAWPFLVGALAGWVIARVWRAPSTVLRSGLPVWAGALVLGMLLRLATGSGAALPFVLVATGSLALGLLGWRIVATVVRRLAGRRR